MKLFEYFFGISNLAICTRLADVSGGKLVFDRETKLQRYGGDLNKVATVPRRVILDSSQWPALQSDYVRAA